MAGRFRQGHSKTNMVDLQAGTTFFMAVFLPFVALFIFCFFFYEWGTTLTVLFTLALYYHFGIFGKHKAISETSTGTQQESLETEQLRSAISRKTKPQIYKDGLETEQLTN